MSLSSQAQVAKACRQYMKSIGVKATCRSESFAGGTAVRVEFEDQSPEMSKQIHDELGKYQYGHFDGQTDMYEYSNSRDDIPQTKYLSINNYFSDELKQKAWEFICNHYGDATNQNPVYADADKNQHIMGQYVDQFMYRFLMASYDNETSAEFWTTITASKTNKRAASKTNNTPVENVTVSEGTKEGYVEIRFPAKPEAAERTELKTAGFRWSPRNTCWWGKANRLPEGYQALA